MYQYSSLCTRTPVYVPVLQSMYQYSSLCTSTPVYVHIKPIYLFSILVHVPMDFRGSCGRLVSKDDFLDEIHR